ncbi:MAG: SCO family protein [Proteobacteria bacterium]|nr:SCO family protein [Pseudomonadota bacterium]
MTGIGASCSRGFQYLAIIFLFVAPFARAEVSIENRQGGFIEPAQYLFKDENGVESGLDRFFTGKPVLLSFVYFECPGACTVLLNELIKGLTPHILLPGKDFELVVISINPEDTPALAKKKRDTYLARYERPDTVDGWHFLTGTESRISAITRRLGFHFERDPGGRNFNHPSALYFLTPDGVISGILGGLTFPGAEVRANLVTAREKGRGTVLGLIGSYCLTFLPHRGWLDRPSRWLLFLLALGAGGGLVHLLLKARKKRSRLGGT